MSARTEHAPQLRHPVALRGGQTGYVERVVAFWPAVRCWDVFVADPEHDGDPPFGFSFNMRDVRNAQIRGTIKGGEPWQEVEL